MKKHCIVAFAVSSLVLAADPEPLGRVTSMGTRKLHLQCTGTGAPVVLFLNGVPRFSLHFALVQPEVAKFTRACVFDRAGEAWSPAIPGEPSAAATIDEIDAVVRHVSPGAPLILAGHSFGGLLARAYHAKHPERVAGIVLIDSVADPPVVPVGAGKKPMSKLTAEDVSALAAQMAQRQKPASIPDPKIEPPFDRLPMSLQTAHVWATRNWREWSLHLDPAAGIQYQVDMNRAAENHVLGDLPLIVITHAKSADEADPWIEQQERLAKLSGKGRLVRAVGSGHDVQLDQPGTVVDAIRTVVDAARPGR